MKKFLASLFLFLIPVTFSLAQVDYILGEASVMTITGTSTIHDWTSKVKEINGKFTFHEDIQSKKLPKSGSVINHIELSIPVIGIESPRGETMDNKTYNALKYEQHPNIIFSSTSDEMIEITDKNTESFTISVSGNLTVAGVTKAVVLNLQGQRKSMNSLWFKGSFPIDMEEYEMTPPSAMFGQIKTGKDVIIEFELVLDTK